jgi:hypothetical protein
MEIDHSMATHLDLVLVSFGRIPNPLVLPNDGSASLVTWITKLAEGGFAASRGLLPLTVIPEFRR